MKILNSSLLYVSILFLTVGLFFSVLPVDVSAQDSTAGCSIEITNYPSSATVGQISDSYDIKIDCDQTSEFIYSLKNDSDGEYIIDPVRVTDEGKYSDSATHIFSSSGVKHILAEVFGVFPEELYHLNVNWTDSVATNVSESPIGPSPTMKITNLSGPSDVEVSGLNAAYRYVADFDWSGDQASYRFSTYKNSSLSSRTSWKTTTSNSVDHYQNWIDEGTFQLCVEAFASEGNTLSGTPDSKCMNVVVTQSEDLAQYDADFISQNVPTQVEPGQTFGVSITMRNTKDTWSSSNNFRLGSQNPRDNIIWGIKRVNLPRSIVNQNENVTFNFTAQAPNREGTYDFQWRMVQERVTWFGDLTDNVRIKVQSEEQVNFCDENPNHPDCIDDPEPPQPSATLNVNSSNPSSGVPITGTGNLDSNNTPYSITKTTNLSGSLIAEPTASNGNVFKNWSGCESFSGTNCRVSVSTGNLKTVTAIYEQPNSSPVVNAGQDHWVLTNREYGHSGAFATDQDGNLASYQWSWDSCKDYDNNSFTCPQLTGTSGSISGGDANISGPYYTPTKEGHYTTRLTVTDTRGSQATDTAVGTTPQGSDGIDNDGDGFTDYPDDPDLEGHYDNQESASSFNFDIFRFFER